MPLSAGDKLGQYEITSLLGAGGMGEVYRARDTQLKREVALKILAPGFDADPERIARFQREAEVLASLNHPNIAHLYGLAEADGVRALVMELVEGESPQGPMPFEDAWKIMTQVAQALEYAHERRVAHRDLKPANLKVTADGRVKILDFGLAKALSNTPTRAESGPNSPTITMGATQAGMILGTAAYMAPEQIKGKEADRRADIWAFGVVLYELLAGERPFQGSDSTEIMARAITSDPVLEKAPPIALRLLTECLKKDPAERLGWIGDAGRLIEEATAVQPSATAPSGRGSVWGGWIAAGVIALLAIAAVSWAWLRRPPLDTQSVRYTIDAPPNARFASTYFDTAISPDGRWVVFGANRSNGTDITLWIRAMDSLDARELAGTEGANGPFWSPDSNSIGFVAASKLKRVDIGGGTPQVLCDTGTYQGGTWNEDGTILFSSGNVLQRVAASGGAPTPVTTLDTAAGEVWHRFPSFLPDGKRFLFTIVDANAKGGVYVASLDAPKQRTRLAQSVAKGLYAPPRDGHPGYLLWLRGDTLMAQRFDGKSRVEGDPISVAHPIAKNGADRATFWISGNGLLLYRGGGGNQEGGRLFRVNRDGKGEELKGVGANYRLGDPRISPDGSRIAMYRGDPDMGRDDIWTYEVARGVPTRLTFEGGNRSPVWSPDGRRIAFSSLRDRSQMNVRDSSGTGQEERLTEGPNAIASYDWSRDGRYILYQTLDSKTGWDVWALPLEGDRKPMPVLQSRFNERVAQFSPDGKWIAYQSDESGGNQIFIQPFPPTGGKWQVSANNATEPRWRGDGKELYFYSGGQIWVAGIRVNGNRIDIEAPRALFPIARLNGPSFFYDVTRDGQHFIVITNSEEPNNGQANPLTVVTNWQAGLK